jgi:vWA found in TerF C terminus
MYRSHPMPPAVNPAYSAQFAAAPAHSDSDDDHDEGIHGHCLAAQKQLSQYGFPPSHKAKIAIALDVSGSMENPNQFYSSGKIERLLIKAMSMAIELSPNAKHSVTIFPFGSVAFPPIVIEEHDIENVIELVFASIGRNYSNGTDYNTVAMKIREYYFGSSQKLTKVVPSDQQPVICLFVTDGEPREGILEAKNQFKSSEFNAIFFKFIALVGKQDFFRKNEEPFSILKEICNTKKAFVPNKDLIILDDPDKLTIVQLFKKYRVWAEEAHHHGILETDPEFDFDDKKRSHDSAEKNALTSLNKQHNHRNTGKSHGHVNATDDDHDDEENHDSGWRNLILLGLAGAVVLPLVVTWLPVWLMVTTGFGLGALTHVVSNMIHDCICPVADDADHHGGDESDDDHEEDHASDGMRTFQQLQSASQYVVGISAPAPIQYKKFVYSQQADQGEHPSVPPPPYQPYQQYRR